MLFYRVTILMTIEDPEPQALLFNEAPMAASNDADILKDVSAKIASGELHASAPCEEMVREWTAEEKEKFNSALAEAFARNFLDEIKWSAHFPAAEVGRDQVGDQYVVAVDPIPVPIEQVRQEMFVVYPPDPPRERQIDLDDEDM